MAQTRAALPFLLARVDPDDPAVRVHHAAVHGLRGEAPGRFATGSDRNEPALATESVDVGQNAVERLLQRLTADAHPRRELVRGDRSDEIFSGARGRYCGGAVVGVGAGPDQRRVAD